MARNFGVSAKTLLLISNLALVAPFPSLAGTSGMETEMQVLEDEIAAARNELDEEAVKPGVKPDDPALKAKEAAIEEKRKRLEQLFRERTTRKAGAPIGGTRTTGSPAPSESPKEPETVLSGEGVQAEIKYRKKKKDPKKDERPLRGRPTPSPTSEEEDPTPAPTGLGGGIQEIQYEKKPSPTPTK
jgi:hypothetical protein